MIGKSRHLNTRQDAPGSLLDRGAFGQGCGVLHHSPSPGTYQHRRHAPPDELAGWVEHFWLEKWNLRGCSPQTRVVLPHPNVHLVFAPGRSKIYGVQLRRFARELKDQDSILGIKFRAGAFYPFFGKPISTIANSSVLAEHVFPDAVSAEQRVLTCNDDHAMVEAAANFLIAHLPARDPNVGVACSIVEAIANDGAITRVEHLVARLGLPERKLQRLFHRYIGASPRWVIKRYRVYDVLTQLTAGEPVAGATLAQNMGYFDQAHLYNDFRKMIGCSPGEYLDSK
ncbi:AraC family transcriptional regulator [Dyella sp. Tek66A03]|uniref:AraC family transcriptional regulator n=1 Tax=Dyella sp. Tek66A03 TaxID=3458298 RepID=UPI00403E70FD